ncbi:unnamed protein product [Lymnaea stagnalis]|uniref:Major facilitator superfamily (MFS) profile domain-containing protein n=1 Tax=Lymnaea stagnalis TaxID=6523 RepID=A0AAV2I9W8_LYMST
MKKVIRKKPPPPLDRHWAWMIVLGVFIFTFFMVGLGKSFGLFLMKFQNKFGASMALATMPMSVAAFIGALGSPAALIIGERFTPQRVVIVGATVGLVGIALSSLLLDMSYVIVFFGISYGVGNSSFYGNGLLMIGKYFRKYRSLATGIGLAGASIGQFVMPPVIEYLLETYGLGGTLLIISAMYFHACISGALFRPIEQYGPEEVVVPNIPEEAQNFVAKSNEKEENGVPVTLNGNATDRKSYVSFQDFATKDTKDLIHDDPDVDKRGSRRWSNDQDEEIFIQRRAFLASTGSIFLASPSVLDISQVDKSAHGLSSTTTAKPATGWRRVFDFSVLRSYVTLHFTLVSFLCFFGFFNFILFLPAILAQKGIEGYDKAMLLSICGVGDLIARIGTGIFADLNLIARYKIKAMACLLSGFNIFIFLFADSFPWLGFHSFLYGFLGGSYVCLMSVVIVDLVGLALMSKNLAVILLIQGVGASIGQIFLGWIRDLSGSFNIVIILCSLSMAAGGLLLLAYPFVRRREDARLMRVQAKHDLSVSALA